MTTPVLKTILEAGAAYPLVRELMQFAQNDKLGQQVKDALAKVGADVKTELVPPVAPPPIEPIPHTRPGT